MTQWLVEAEERKRKDKLCNKLANYLEAVLEETGFHLSTPLLEGAEKALYEWKHS